MFIRRSLHLKAQAPQVTQSLVHIPGSRSFRSQRGFTLIEIIATLVLVGILAAVGGMAIVQVVKGYMIVKENSATTQKAQLVMTRLTREIIDMIYIPTDASVSVLPINNISGNRIIGLDNGAVKIAVDPTTTLADGDILIDNVSAFTLTYYSRNASTGAVVTTTTWPAASDITTLTAIDINLQLTQPGSGTLIFTSRIAPRNNKNESGATLPTGTIPTIPTGWGLNCFVATAAYGDSGHPMVQILRDFRDRHLLPWQAGRWFVKQYYEHGPAAAELISNRPVAMWTVRCLLAPVVALVFCLMYAPMAMFFILLASLIVTCALFSAYRSGLPLISGVIRARGSVLVGLIITIVIMATLGAAMLTMFSSSYMNQAYADQGRKTYFMAESGFRYAASYFLNAGDAGRDAAMTELNNKTCNLSGNAGSFTTIVFPYWFKTQAASAGATTLATQVSGTVPLEFTGTFSGGQILVGSSYYSYSAGSGSGTAITFSGLSPSLPLTAAGLVVQPVTQPASNQSIASGGTGSLTLGTGFNVFPLLNGNIIMKGEAYNYRKRTGATLYNITKSNGTANANWTSAVSVTTTDKIILDKFIQLSSTGTIGNASRVVVYNVPIGFLTGSGEFAKQQDFVPDMTGFVAPAGGGTFSNPTVDGGTALKVDSAPSTGGYWTNTGNWAYAFFNGYSNTNLAKAWMDAGGCLSYDLQVKVYNTQPYYFAGMNFRASNNSDNTDLYTYGVSLIKPRQTRICFFGCGSYGAPSDQTTALIPYYVSDDAPGPLFSNPGVRQNLEETSAPLIGIQSIYGLPAIVFWKRNSAGFQWLAYRILTEADGIVTYNSSTNAWRLVNWSTLMVRVIEGYEMSFTNGRVDTSSKHLKYGDIITNAAGTKTARVIGTPILNTNWGSSPNSTNAAGTLILTNRPVDANTGSSNPFTSGENLYLVGGETGVVYAIAGTQAVTKANYIMVYYSDNKTPVAGNTVQADNTRIGNQRGYANWPPDDWTNMAAGLPTADPAGNDYFSLVQWRYPVSGSGLSLSVTPASGWSYSDPNLSRVAAYGTPIIPSLTSGWTLGAWTYNSGYLRKNTTSTSTATYPVSTTAGTKYDVTMTIYRTSSDAANRTASYQFGGVSGGNITGTRNTYVNYGPTTFTAAGSTTIFAITGNNAWQGRLTALSVTPHITAADQPVTHATIASGTTYNVAVNVSSLTTGDFYYTIGGCTSSTCSAIGSCNLTCTASNTNPLTFVSPAAGNLFTINSISVSTADTYVGTLNTSADTEGNVASYVTALNTTDFYMAVIKTSALLSPTWYPASTTGPAASTTANFVGPNGIAYSGDSVALVTSSGSATSTYYDDFAIQLDLKGGSGFLPPIQQ